MIWQSNISMILTTLQSNGINHETSACDVTCEFLHWAWAVFSAMENNVMPVKTAVEVEENLKKEFEKKLKVDDRLIIDPLKSHMGG